MTRIVKKISLIIMILVLSVTLTASSYAQKEEVQPVERIIRHISEIDIEEISIIGGQKAYLVTITVWERKYIDGELIYDITYELSVVESNIN